MVSLLSLEGPWGLSWLCVESPRRRKWSQVEAPRRLKCSQNHFCGRLESLCSAYHGAWKVLDPPWKLTPSDFDSLRRLQGGLKEAKIGKKMILVVVKTKKSENVNFVHPSLAKSLFLGSQEGQDEWENPTRSDFLSV